MQGFPKKAVAALKKRPALTLSLLAALLPVLSLLLSSTLRVLLAKGDFAPVFGELEREVLPILRAMRDTDSLSGFFASADPTLRKEALLLSLSPLNLPILLAPLSALRLAVTVSVALRLALASLTMTFFLRKIGCSPLPSLALSLAYALSSYATVSFASLSQLDLLILFPLTVLGILRIARGRGGALFGAALGLSILLCPSAVGSLLIFSILLYVYFRIVTPCPERKGAASAAVFSVALLLGVTSALSALVTFLSISRFSPSSYPFRQTLDFLDFCAKLLPGSFDGLSDAALPYLSVGVLPLLLSVVFFSSRSVPIRVRIASGGLWFLLFFSFSISAINGVYSLFIPTLPLYSHAYLFVFLLTATGAYAWRYLSATAERTLILSSGVIVLFAMILQKLDPTYTQLLEDKPIEYGYISELAILWIPMLSAILFTAALSMIGRAGAVKRALPRAAVALLLVTVCVEGALGSYALTGMAKKHRGQSYLADADYTAAFSDSVLSALALTERDELYRVISSSALTAHDGSYFGYHSLTSLPEGILTDLGIRLNASGCFEGAEYPLALSLLGVRHYVERVRIPIDKNKDGEPIYDQPAELPEEIRAYFNEGYTVLGDEEEATSLFTSDLALPLLFASHSDLSDLSLGDTSLITVLNEYFRQSTGDASLTLFNELPPLNIFGTKAEQSTEGYTVYNGSRVRIKATVPSTAPLYFTLTTAYPRESTLSVTANGTTVNYPLYEDATADPSIAVALGSFEKDTVVEVSINFQSSSDGRFYLPENATFLRQEDSEAAEEAIRRLVSRGASDLRFSGDTLHATVVTSGESAILTTLPYDFGITVKVDGKTVQTTRALGEFLAIPIASDGEHTVTLTLSEPVGLAPTLLSVLGALLLTAVAALELLVCRGRLHLPYLSVKATRKDGEEETK